MSACSGGWSLRQAEALEAFGAFAVDNEMVVHFHADGAGGGDDLAGDGDVGGAGFGSPLG